MGGTSTSSYNGRWHEPYVDGDPDARALQQRTELGLDQAHLDDLVKADQRANNATKGGGGSA